MPGFIAKNASKSGSLCGMSADGEHRTLPAWLRWYRTRWDVASGCAGNRSLWKHKRGMCMALTGWISAVPRIAGSTLRPATCFAGSISLCQGESPMSDREQGRLADWLAGDWGAALDDLLCSRWSRCGCTICGVRPLAWEEIRTLPCGLSVATALCESCHRQDRDRRKLDALLAQRYAQGGPLHPPLGFKGR
jgi:hypothetical protein